MSKNYHTLERPQINKEARQALINRGVRPESLPPAEDVKKVQRRLASAEKKVIKNPDGLEDK